MPGTRRLLAAAAVIALLPAALAAQLPTPPPGATIETAPPPHWPEPVRPRPGAPNVLIVMTDDVGFGASSTFGGPIPTPTFDALARTGLRYNRFHTTAICSPTRAALLTGRNPQAVGMGYVANWSSGYDGYTSRIPDSAATLPRLLRDAGYATAMIGKGHVTPEWEMGPSGPFDRWPTGLGFDYFYGFLGADTSAFEPALVENTRPVTPPADPDYVLDQDLADHAIDWLERHRATQPDRPFFLYLAPGTAHAPNQAPAEWLARFRGRFDGGWDAMRQGIVARQKALGVIPATVRAAARPPGLPLWNSLPADKRRLYARYMEAYAAALAFADDQVGRVIEALRRDGTLDNTLVIYIQGDNGASAEGGLDGKLFEQSALAGVREDPAYAMARIDEIGTRTAYNLMPGGWGWALNAPFPWAKRYASHLGGTRNAMVIAWPGHVSDPGGLRDQYLHVSDVMPTVLEAAGVVLPDVVGGVRQQPVTGISAAYTFMARNAPSHRRSQIYAMAENLAIYRDGWLAATMPKANPFAPGGAVPLADRRWELYDLTRDFSQSHDVATREPRRLADMVGDFWRQAGPEHILPIHTSEGQQAGRPDPNRDRHSFTYYAPVAQLAESVAPNTVGRSFTIEADVSVAADTGGVIMAQGGRFGGYALFLDDGRPSFTFALTPAHVTRLAASEPLASGGHRLALDFAMSDSRAGAPARATLSVDGVVVATGDIAQTFARVVSHNEGFDVGQDLVSPVDPAGYASAGSAFGGRLDRVTITVR